MLWRNENYDLEMLRNSKYNIAFMDDLGMKWYKFNIYFRLFFSIFVLLADIASARMNYGSLWGISLNMDIYLCFAIVFDLVLIVGALLVRHWLAHFDKKGVRYYFVTQYLSQAVISIAILSLLGINEYSFRQVMGRLIAYGIFFAFDYKYWKKRIHLFNDSEQSTYAYSCTNDSAQAETPYVNNQINDKEKIRYCRKCGFKLIDDSDFCSQCGTKIIKSVEMIQNEVL